MGCLIMRVVEMAHWYTVRVQVRSEEPLPRREKDSISGPNTLRGQRLGWRWGDGNSDGGKDGNGKGEAVRGCGRERDLGSEQQGRQKGDHAGLKGKNEDASLKFPTLQAYIHANRIE